MQKPIQTPKRKLKPKPKPKPRRQPRTEAEKEKARKRVRLVRRIILLTLFAGFMGIFLYNNRDYFLPALDNYSIADLLPKKDEAAEMLKAIKKAEADSIKAEDREILKRLRAAKKAESDSIRAEKRELAERLRADKKAVADSIWAAREARADSIKAAKRLEAEMVKAYRLAEAERKNAAKMAAVDSIIAAKAQRADSIKAAAETDNIKADTIALADSIKTDNTAAADNTGVGRAAEVKSGDWVDWLVDKWPVAVNFAGDLKKLWADSARAAAKAEDKKAKADRAERKRAEKLNGKKPEAPKEPKTAKSLDEIIGGPEFADSALLPLRPGPVKIAESKLALKGAPIWAIEVPESAPKVLPEQPKPDSAKPVPVKIAEAEPVQPSKPEPPAPAETADSVPEEDKFSLSDVRCKLADRDDLTIYLTAELIFNGEPVRQEIIFKRGALTAVAGSVVREHEYGNVSTAKISRDLLTAFNEILLAGNLNRVDVKDFRVEPNQ